jgi:methylmalonyl-CoA mutase
MPEAEAKAQALNLRADFPPVTTEAWEAVIQTDLKGADYNKKLVWRTDEGLSVRPYYRQENLAGLESQTSLAPGQFPYVRGSGASWKQAQGQPVPAGAIRADLLHEAGAHAVQEVAFAIAGGVEKLAELTKSKPVDEAAGSIEFVFAVGAAYFIEIAKLRAARMLWAQAVAAFGPKDLHAAKMNILARTARLNKSRYDQFTNLLRVTTEAMSAVLGGADAINVEPFGFEPHLADSVHRVLREEAHLDAVADPSAGSYYIETLTDSIASAAWKLFQEVEAAGGYAKAIESGMIAKAVATSRAAKEKAISTRRKALVGVNNYPNTMEKTSDVVAPVETAAAPAPAFRLAEPFEAIRQRSIDFAAKTGRYPKVLLLKRGDVKMRGARATFTLNFLGCAAFDIVESDQFEGSDADLIVLCSSDAEYLDLAKEVCPKAKVPVLVAGNPKDQIEALQAAGVQGFIHIMSDAVATLTEWQKRLGVGA